ncbi:penicillin-binding protein [Enemella dayhoffiae]|uniref:Penicillin-binding protein n=1 Tax=Enemella dayhoffiae TaxID=2016507 RepID=A0A255GRV9_9ACTN|nr:transglycosylase domain-containing protein [Enemella dayhoffiae]OYO18567.1 penicillin-binding protein [Enemella dayhoffiae]
MAEPAKRTSSRAKGSKKQRGRFKAIALRTLTVLLIAGLVTGIAGVVGVAWAYQRTEIPDPNAEFQSNTSYVYFRDGETRMGNFMIQNRQSIDYDKMPASIKDAVVAAENRTFWTDRGISIPGMIRAAFTIAKGGEMQGGSTITQQYIKILYLTSDRTLTRKFKELFLAVKLGREVPKEQILQGYLNTIYFGRGAYGIQSASRAYFNVNADQLTVPQAAVLASVLNNPSALDPSDPEDHQRLLDRYRYTLQGMEEMGKLSAAQTVEFSQKLPDFPEIPLNQRYAGSNGYLLKMIEQELAAKGMSQAQIAGGGLKIVTTFDTAAQDAAVASAQKYTQQAATRASKKQDPNQLHAAIASVDNASGEVLALYGGADYLKSQRNWATTARQTGSTFKAFALAAGLRDGFNLYSTFEGDTFTPKGDSVPSRNEFSQQYGPVNLIEATAQSINTAFVDLTVQLSDKGRSNGPEKVLKGAEDAGAPRGSGWDPNSNRITLGIPEVSPLAMAGAYATFANDGKQIAPHVVREVFDDKGNSIYKADTTGKQAFDQGVARDVTFALSNVVEQGTGRQVATLDRPVAGKTGTAGVRDDVISSWFVGYTKQISTAVMYVAGDAGTSDLDPFARPGDQTFFGGSYPAMTWADYMKVATKGQKVLDFPDPAFVNRNKARNPAPTKSTNPTARPTPSASAAPSTPPPTSSAPPTTQPPTTQPPTTQPPTTQPPSSRPPTTTGPPPTTRPPATAQATQGGPGGQGGQAGQQTAPRTSSP